MSADEDYELELFENPHPNNNFMVHILTHEFTCVCPMTGQPDFASIRIRYIPNAMCFELKSLKLYLWTFRDEGHFHEDVTNRILNKLSGATAPKWMEVEGKFNTRGGIATTVNAQSGQLPEWAQVAAPLGSPTILD